MSLPPDTVFRIANGVALLCWMALLLSPPSTRWARAVWRVSGRVIPLLLSVGYLALLAVHWRGEGGFGSIEQVRALFDVPGALVAGWLHYLAFDLFVGAWIAQRSAELGIPHGWVVPVLVLTFMFGPLGLLAFALLRLVGYRASIRLLPERAS